MSLLKLFTSEIPIHWSKDPTFLILTPDGR